MLGFENKERGSERFLVTGGEHAPREYSLGTSALLTVKLFLIAGSVVAVLWVFDALLAP